MTGKEATPATRRAQQRALHDVALEDQRLLDDPLHGLIAEFGDRVVRDAGGRTVWTLKGFEFLAAEVSHPDLRALVGRFVADETFRERLRLLPATPEGHHSYSGGLLEHTVAVTSLCHESGQLHPRLRGDLLTAAALLHDCGRVRELDRGPLFLPTPEGKLLGHVHLGLRMIEDRAESLDRTALAEVLHAVGSHHDARAARHPAGPGHPQAQRL